jgi:glycerol-3-phosphate dehydrogenase
MSRINHFRRHTEAVSRHQGNSMGKPELAAVHGVLSQRWEASHGEGLSASRAWRDRQQVWSGKHAVFDVIIIGGGVQGACLYDKLVREGRRVLLVDRGDFGGGTSQASAMLIWGGFLYLKDFDIASVVCLSAARDRLLRQRAEQVEPQSVTFCFGEPSHRRPWTVHAALRLYWLLALGQRTMPHRLPRLPGHSFVRECSAKHCLGFEEGRLRLSDAQFVIHWIHAGNIGGRDNLAMNYCEAVDGSYDAGLDHWRVRLRDTLGRSAMEVSARWIVNAAGTGAERVDAQFQIESPWKHLLAKGVAITIARPEDHADVLVFDDEAKREGLSLVPWGPVSLWGSTEELVTSADNGWKAEPRDVTFLLDSLNSHLRVPLATRDVIALRSGVRAIVVPRGCTSGDPLKLSKRWRVCRDRHRPWIIIFGGKLTACQSVAARTSALLSAGLGPPRFVQSGGVDDTPADEPEMTVFAGVSVASPRWCVENQWCWTLEDYLRRRTNLAQWIPRGGLGTGDEHAEQLAEFARAFALPAVSPCGVLAEYRERIAREHDCVLGLRSTPGGVS